MAKKAKKGLYRFVISDGSCMGEVLCFVRARSVSAAERSVGKKFGTRYGVQSVDRIACRFWEVRDADT